MDSQWWELTSTPKKAWKSVSVAIENLARNCDSKVRARYADVDGHAIAPKRDQDKLAMDQRAMQVEIAER